MIDYIDKIDNRPRPSKEEIEKLKQTAKRIAEFARAHGASTIIVMKHAEIEDFPDGN